MNAKNTTGEYKNHDELLEALVAEVALSETVLDKIESRYQAIATHLAREESSIQVLSPKLYPQGSVNLGTANQPLNSDDEVDVDIVVELTDASKDTFTQKSLKGAVYSEVAAYAKSHGMVAPEDGKRCATLNYRDHDNGGYNFHVDILPAIPDQEGYRAILESSFYSVEDDLIDGAIAITCKEHPGFAIKTSDWPVSNPQGYARWFESRQSSQLDEQRTLYAKRRGIHNIDSIPMFRLSTPLQKVIKLLKRHRDATMGNDENKPISIIITTLAAHAYQGEHDISSALNGVLERMENFIQATADGSYVIPNPVNPAENFADRWTNDVKVERFFQWLRQVRSDYGSFLGKSIYESRRDLGSLVSENTVLAIAQRLPVEKTDPNSLLGAMQEDESNGFVDTDKLLQLIHLGIDGRVDWQTVEHFAQTNFDLASGEHRDVAKINFYQVARHQGIELSKEAAADVVATMEANRDSAAFELCGNLLLGTASRKMVKNCIASVDYTDVLSWPIIRLLGPQ